MGCEEVEELGIPSGLTRVEMTFQGRCLCALQAQRRQVSSVVGYHRPVFWGGYDGLALISAHVSQWDNGPCVPENIDFAVANTSSDVRKYLE